MAYKDILVYLDPTPASAARLAIALQIAVVDGAYVTGVDATAEAAFQGEWRDAATGIEAGFHAALHAEGAAGEFRVLEGKAARPFATPADLAIAPSPSIAFRKLIHAGLPDEVVKQSGAPTLVVPTDWPGGAWGGHIVIAWNGSRESNRAVRDALPLLRRAAKVGVFVFSDAGGELRQSADRLVAHLARHAVSATVSDWTDTGDVTAVEALFASLDMQTADLLVAGGFGHTGLFEGLTGSVSRELLRQPVLPLLMSH